MPRLASPPRESDRRLTIFPIRLPSRNLAAHLGEVRNTATETMPAQGAQFDLGHVQPASLLRGVVDLEPFRQLASLLWAERLV